MRDTYQAGYVVDEEGRVTDQLSWEIDESGVTTTYSNYDAAGNARTVTRGALLGLPALVTKREFDALGRTILETQRDSADSVLQSRSSMFDTRGRTKNETVNGQTTNFAYAFSRVWGRSF